MPLIDHCVKNKRNLTEVWLVLPFYKVGRKCMAMLVEYLSRTCSFQKGTLYDEYQRLSSKNEKMSETRILKLFLGICKGVLAFHTHQPQPLAHRCVLGSM